MYPINAKTENSKPIIKSPIWSPVFAFLSLALLDIHAPIRPPINSGNIYSIIFSPLANEYRLTDGTGYTLYHLSLN